MWCAIPSVVSLSLFILLTQAFLQHYSSQNSIVDKEGTGKKRT